MRAADGTLRHEPVGPAARFTVVELGPCEHLQQPAKAMKSGSGLNALTLGGSGAIPESIVRPTFDTGGEVAGQIYDKYLKNKLVPC